MSMWDSSFGKSVIITWIKDQIDLLWASVTGGDPPDLDAKSGAPDTFADGNFATYNSTNNQIEDTGYNETDFVAAEAEKGLSSNDFTDGYKDVLDTLGEDFDPDEKMDKLTPTSGTLDKLTAVGSEGNVYATTKSAYGVAADYELSMPVPSSYPHTYNLDTITVEDDAAQTAHIFYTLGHADDFSQARAGNILVMLDNEEDPVAFDFGVGIKGTDFDDDLAFSINDGKLRISYTVTDGGENPTYLKLLILQQ